MSEQDDHPADQEGTDATAAAVQGAGDERVDEAMSRLAELDATPVQEHAAIVEAIHRTLQDTLVEDEG